VILAASAMPRDILEPAASRAGAFFNLSRSDACPTFGAFIELGVVLGASTCQTRSTPSMMNAGRNGHRSAKPAVLHLPAALLGFDMGQAAGMGDCGV